MLLPLRKYIVKAQIDMPEVKSIKKYLYAHSYDLKAFQTKLEMRKNLEDFIDQYNKLGLQTIKLKEEYSLTHQPRTLE